MPTLSRRSRRNITDRVFWIGCAIAFAALATPAISILISVFHQAFPALGWSLLTKRTGADYVGIQNAVLGTLLLLLGVLVVAGTIGIGAGIYLAEFSGSGRVSRWLRFFSEVLAGMPSIVIGYIGYVTLVVEFHWGFSLAAGVLALSVLVLPYIVKTTEVALRQVPNHLYEGAAALGTPRWRTVAEVILPPAIPGIVSGLVVALAISTGELAPLLFTAGFSDRNPTFHLTHHQVPYLTNVTFTDLALPGNKPHQIAAAAGAITLVILVVLIAIGRMIAARARRV